MTSSWFFLSTLLDFFITSGTSKSYTKIERNYDLSSDHTPVTATVSTALITVTKTPKLRAAKTNWQEYRNILDAQIKLNFRLKTPEEIEQGMEKLIVILQEAATQATPPPDIQKTTKTYHWK